LGQLLQVIPDIKHYILNPIPSKLTLPKLVVASIVIDHQMVMIQVQLGIFFIKDVFLDGDFGVNVIMQKNENVVRSDKTKTYTLQPTHC
jgi:hypothetical protein